MELKQFFEEHNHAALAFSGGVDSTFLLHEAKRFGANIHAYIVKTPFQPESETCEAIKLAKSLNADFDVLETDVLTIPEIMDNLPNRCFFCKKVLFNLIKTKAELAGYELILEGTNASDDVNDRPGYKALQELSVLSPLKECGLSKDDIRRLSREAGLPTWNKPSYSCLATRIPFGEALTPELLSRIEGAEKELLLLGYSDFRARYFHNAVRLQLKKNQMRKSLDDADILKERLKPYFNEVLLDFENR